MHSGLSNGRSPRRDHAKDERGAVAIIAATGVAGLLVIAALVLDFGIARVDRQVNKSVADSCRHGRFAHDLNVGDGQTHPFRGVCTAVRYLQRNDRRFATVSTANGWSDGAGSPTGNGCTTASLQAPTCTVGDPATWARWTYNGTWRGEPSRSSSRAGTA